MTPAETDRVKKIAALLSSPHDGERSAAAARLTAMATERRMTMAELLQAAYGGSGGGASPDELQAAREQGWREAYHRAEETVAKRYMDQNQAAPEKATHWETAADAAGPGYAPTPPYTAAALGRPIPWLALGLTAACVLVNVLAGHPDAPLSVILFWSAVSGWSYWWAGRVSVIAVGSGLAAILVILHALHDPAPTPASAPVQQSYAPAPTAAASDDRALSPIKPTYPVAPQPVPQPVPPVQQPVPPVGSEASVAPVEPLPSPAELEPLPEPPVEQPLPEPRHRPPKCAPFGPCS